MLTTSSTAAEAAHRRDCLLNVYVLVYPWVYLRRRRIYAIAYT
jgi:hypothetical protein